MVTIAGTASIERERATWDQNQEWYENACALILLGMSDAPAIMDPFIDPQYCINMDKPVYVDFVLSRARAYKAGCNDAGRIGWFGFVHWCSNYNRCKERQHETRSREG